jgi:serine/threonine protein kinase
MMDSDLVANRYRLQKPIGKGAYGIVYLALDTESQEKVAIKLESTRATSLSISNEAQILSQLQGHSGIPKLFSYGSHNFKNYIAIQKLGQSLTHTLKCSSKPFSSKTVAKIGLKMLERIEKMHSLRILHRDIKPDHFLYKGEKLYIIDFGIARLYINSNTFHIPYGEISMFIGTPSFASRNAHSRIQLSRRDDLESFCYSLSYLLKGKLPWVNKDPAQNSENKIWVRKTRTSIWELFSNTPAEFIDILMYVRGLEFYIKPDYQYIRRRLKRVVEGYSENDLRSLNTSLKKVKKRKERRKSKTFVKELKMCEVLTEKCEDWPEFTDEMVFRIKSEVGVEKYIETNEMNIIESRKQEISDSFEPTERLENFCNPGNIRTVLNKNYMDSNKLCIVM